MLDPEVSPLRVHFDDQVFVRQSVGGVSRYFVELAKELERTNPGSVSFHGTWALNTYAVAAGYYRPLPRLAQNFHVASRLNRLNRVPADARILHHTLYDTGFPKRVPAIPRIITVYDMIPELAPQFFPAGNPFPRKEEAVRGADVILVISRTVSEDLTNVYGELRAPLVVTPLGVDAAFFSDSEAQSTTSGASENGILDQRLHGPFFLYVGRRAGYKNCDLLFEAFARSGLAKSHELYLVGGGPLTAEERERLRALGVQSRVTQLSCSESSLRVAYHRATALVVPSLFEGFGLPLIEAMASGCATVASDTSALREVGGEACLYFNPKEPEELANCLRAITVDDHLRNRLVARGRSRAAAFTWSDTARKTIGAYELVL